MGWFWDLKPSAPEDTNTDPLRDLDPSLADFLSKESPPSYSTSAPPPSLPPPPPPPAPPEPASSAPPSSTSSSTSSSSSTSQLAPPPPPTLYPDGRFAHLWANYRPLSEVEWAVKTDQERLADVLEDYKERKASIARAALENCTLEQDSVNECFTRGPWTKRVTMCREENKAFERCYLMQSVCYITIFSLSLSFSVVLHHCAPPLFLLFRTQHPQTPRVFSSLVVNNNKTNLLLPPPL